MPKTQKIPLRKCLGCGEMKPKKELIRIVRTPEGAVLPDETGKMNGRGAYLCKNKDCLLQAQKARRLERAFSAPVPQEVYAALEEAFSQS